MAIFKTVYTTFVNQLKLPKRGTFEDKNNHTVMLKLFTGRFSNISSVNCI